VPPCCRHADVISRQEPRLCPDADPGLAWTMLNGVRMHVALKGCILVLMLRHVSLHLLHRLFWRVRPQEYCCGNEYYRALCENKQSNLEDPGG